MKKEDCHFLLRSNVNRGKVAGLVEGLENAHATIANGEISHSSLNELRNIVHNENVNSVSIKTFLWLFGWCHTDNSRSRASDIAIKLWQELFGYLVIREPLEGIDIKQYRYNEKKQMTICKSLMEYHKEHLR